MTAISSKVRHKLNKKLKVSQMPDIIQIVLCFLTGLASGGSSWCDISMAGTAVVLAYCCDDIACRYALIAGSLVSCGALALTDRGYIAVFLAGIIFTVTDNFTEKRKYALAFAAAVTGICRLFLSYYSLPMEYKLLAMLEPAVIYVAALTARCGTDVMASGSDSRSFTDIACGMVSMLALFLALTGADSHFMYISMGTAVGTGWFYISNGCITAGIISFISGLLVSFDKAGFTYLFISMVAVWFVGGWFSEKMSMAIYPATIISSVAVNVLFISHFNSFALTGSVIAALIIYCLVPHIAVINVRPSGNTFVRGRDWRLLMLSLKKLETSLSFLAGTVIDISKLNEKQAKPQALEDLVAEDICRRCEKNTVCWQEKYSFTQQQFTEYGRKMYWSGENRFSSGFNAQCIKVGELMASFEENSRLLLSRKYIAQSQKNNQKLLQNAFLSISGAVGDLIYQNQRSHLINATITMEMHRLLDELSVGHSYCLCSQNPDQASFAVLTTVPEKELYKILSRIENLYGVKFSSPQVEQQGTELIYIFRARPVYSYDISVKTNRLRQVNGDNRDNFIYNGSLYVILSDGMGTGRLAAAESRTVIAMAKSLITTGVSMKNVIDIINLSLNLKSGGENSASIDILQINLSDGNSIVTKAGAGVSLVLDKQGLTRYYQDSLPLGILKDVKPVECSFRLTAGDTVILMSGTGFPM